MEHPPLHENSLVTEYLNSRYFSGFELKQQPTRIVLLSANDTVVSLLQRAKFIRDDDEGVEIDIAPLVNKRVGIKKATRELRLQYEPEAVDLLDALNTLHAFSDPAVKQRLNDGFAMYADMPVLFARGTAVACNTSSGTLGGVVETCNEVANLFGVYFNIVLSVILPTRKGCCIGKVSHRVNYFDAKQAIHKLSIRPLRAIDKTTLTERGKLFREFTQRPTPAAYSGNITIPMWMRDRVMGANGRIMVDAANFAQIDADLYHEIMAPFEIDEDAVFGTVSDDDLWRCYNRVQGFSMRLKRWGWLDVDGLKPVEWRSDAFEQLVLAADLKKTILSLVEHYGNSFADFIEDKSGGLIFLLFGPVGVGKTLSAEAVAETLHRPLYSVSVGELGTEPAELEEKLRGILDLAYQWNAVLLLDEADIFMEARDTNNITRNAMVSIFLRLLEYYSGVMFLTTNRVQTFDPAFFSRISLAVAYPKLDPTHRHDVWQNILVSAGIDTHRIDLAQLAEFEVNGRNIKTAVRIAQTLAAGDHRQVQQGDLISVLTLTERFNHAIDSRLVSY